MEHRRVGYDHATVLERVARSGHPKAEYLASFRRASTSSSRPADLTAVPQPRKPVPTFAEYVPVVSAAVSAGTRRAYGTYWNRITGHWGGRPLDEPTPSEIRQLMAWCDPDPAPASQQLAQAGGIIHRDATGRVDGS